MNGNNHNDRLRDSKNLVGSYSNEINKIFEDVLSDIKRRLENVRYKESKNLGRKYNDVLWNKNLED